MCLTKAKLLNKKILDSKSPTKKKAITSLFRRVITGPQLQASAVKDPTVPKQEEKRKIAEHNLLSDIGEYVPPTKKRRIVHQSKIIEPNKTSVLEIMELLDLAYADEQKKKKIEKMKEAAQKERRRKVAENVRCQMFIAQREAMIERDTYGEVNSEFTIENSRQSSTAQVSGESKVDEAEVEDLEGINRGDSDKVRRQEATSKCSSGVND
ncbi:hypothetical protein KQX54_020313 [Cotesia glomerata]|uniref:Uncharacterized protein n=1 Tax=Cotesia glomerata TaxID=32391 RepID=A0AAV7IR02_COTGL|nr:hypothetical protein KQX54_020313 [Cotesia glomerata]